MYVGHFAIGLAMQAKKPETPALPILLGVGFLDLLHGAFVLLGWDRVTANLSAGPYLFFDLTFIDWNHSLAMAVVWSLVWGALFWRAGRGVAVLAALAAFSHFVADWPLHNGDLALYPHAVTHLGGGLWGQWGTGAWVAEGVFSAALCAYAWRAHAARRQRGRDGRALLLWPCALLAGSFVTMSPSLSPMKLIAALGEPAAHWGEGLLVLLGFLVPGWVMAWWVGRPPR